MESDTVSFGDNAYNLSKETNNISSFTIGDIIMDIVDLFNLDVPKSEWKIFICEVNNHKQVEVNENIDVNVNSNSNDTMLQDTYNDGASMSTSTELFNDTVSKNKNCY